MPEDSFSLEILELFTFEDTELFSLEEVLLSFKEETFSFDEVFFISFAQVEVTGGILVPSDCASGLVTIIKISKECIQ